MISVTNYVTDWLQMYMKPFGYAKFLGENFSLPGETGAKHYSYYLYLMIVIDDKTVSDDVVEQQFVCDLNACKGACCVEGDFGAPLDKSELEILDKIYD